MKRFGFLNKMIKEHGFRLGAEIGTGKGKTGMEILQANPELHLYQVAFYPNEKVFTNEYRHPGFHDSTLKAKMLWNKRMRRFKNRIIVLAMPSHEAADHIKDESLDFIFIDADHSYENCKQDIELWVPKVRLGGMISGHDYQTLFPGVVKAVDESFAAFELAEDSVWYLFKKGASD